MAPNASKLVVPMFIAVNASSDDKTEKLDFVKITNIGSSASTPR
jgi:hypothetical protein